MNTASFHDEITKTPKTKAVVMMKDGSMMEPGNMAWMMGGMGVFAIIFIAVVVLAIFALIKYLRS
jgi:uncharacterized membrane protein